MKNILKKILPTAGALLLATAMAFQPMAAFASSAATSTNAGFTSSAETRVPEYPKAPSDLVSGSAILMDEDTGAILYDKNMDTIRYPASITKIMTCLVVLEHLGKGDMDDTVTFSEDSINKTEGSGIARQIGEKLTVRQCLYAMMLESANECAYALAEYTGGGDYSKFVDMMNQKAAELGCTHTHFNNCNGLPDTRHYTTAHDMALIAQAAYKNKTFRTLISTKTYTIPKTNKNKNKLVMYNHHAMISSNRTNRYLYDYAVGGKTGYTRAAWNTLVTYAQKDGHTYLTVVLKSTAAAEYTDTRALFDYAFANFDSTEIGNRENRLNQKYLTQGYERAEGERVLSASIDRNASLTLPVEAKQSLADTSTTVLYRRDSSGNQTGTVTYYYAGHKVGAAAITLKTVGGKSSTGKAQTDSDNSQATQNDSTSSAAAETGGSSSGSQTGNGNDSSAASSQTTGSSVRDANGLDRLSSRLRQVDLQKKVIGIPIYVYIIIALVVIVLIIRIVYVRITRKRKRHR